MVECGQQQGRAGQDRTKCADRDCTDRLGSGEDMGHVL